MFKQRTQAHRTNREGEKEGRKGQENGQEKETQREREGESEKEAKGEGGFRHRFCLVGSLSWQDCG